MVKQNKNKEIIAKLMSDALPEINFRINVRRKSSVLVFTNDSYYSALCAIEGIKSSLLPNDWKFFTDGYRYIFACLLVDKAFNKEFDVEVYEVKFTTIKKK